MFSQLLPGDRFGLQDRRVSHWRSPISMRRLPPLATNRERHSCAKNALLHQRFFSWQSWFEVFKQTPAK